MAKKKRKALKPRVAEEEDELELEDAEEDTDDDLLELGEPDDEDDEDELELGGEDDVSEDEDDEPEEQSAWLVKGSEITGALKQHRASQVYRAPETWLKAGQTKILRFVKRDPVGMFWRHGMNLRQGGKVTFRKHICSRNANCRFCRQGMDAYPEIVYVVNDFTPFTRSNGERVLVAQRYLTVSERRHKQVQQVRKHLKGKLSAWLIKITQDPEDNSWSLLPYKEKPKTSSEKKFVPCLSEQVGKFYKKLTAKQQVGILNKLAPDERMI